MWSLDFSRFFSTRAYVKEKKMIEKSQTIIVIFNPMIKINFKKVLPTNIRTHPLLCTLIFHITHRPYDKKWHSKKDIHVNSTHSYLSSLTFFFSFWTECVWALFIYKEKKFTILIILSFIQRHTSTYIHTFILYRITNI